MLDQFLKLLERFVVAHELIAANSAKQAPNKSVSEMTVDVSVAGVETVKKNCQSTERSRESKRTPGRR